MSFPLPPLVDEKATPEAIKHLQGLLKIQQTGIYGQTTRRIVTAWQMRNGVAPTGVVGPTTWAAIARWLYVKLMIAELGVTEHSANDGPRIREYQDAVHMGNGPWCAAYVGWGVLELAKKLKVTIPFTTNPAHARGWLLSGDCWALYDFAKLRGLLTNTPLPGSVFLLDYEHNGDARHTGVLVEPKADEPGVWWTVEGNTNDDGSPEGYEVAMMTRKLAQVDIVTFIR